MPHAPRRLPASLAVFAAAWALAAASMFATLLQRPGASPDWALGMLTQPFMLIGFTASGLFWVGIAETARRFGLMWSWRTVIILAVLAVFPGTFVVHGLSVALTALLIDPAVLGNPRTWSGPAWLGFLAPVPLLSAAARSAVLAMIVLRKRGSRNGRAGRKLVPEGFVMSQQPGQVTRLLCANAFLGGSVFRQKVLGHFTNPATAPAPEIGFDVDQVVQACLFAERRETAYCWGFLGIGLASLVLSSIDLALGLLVLAASAILFFRKRWREQRVLVRHLRRENADLVAAAAQFAVEVPNGIQDAMPPAKQNLTVYKGYQPFVGMGVELASWSFATLLDKPKTAGQGATLPFTIDELYERLGRAVAGLRLESVQCLDHYFVTGTDLREDRTLLPAVTSRPRVEMPVSLARAHVDASDARIRHYKWIRIEDWGGELIFSTVLRCARRGSTLYVEARRFVLPPLATQNRQVDALVPDGWRSRLGLAVGSVVAGPLFCVAAPFALLGVAQEHSKRRGEDRQLRRLIADNPLFDYGSAASLRQKLGQSSYLHYFQQTDTDFYAKVVERKLLDELVQFLDDHEIDTSDIKDRQTMILNSGVWVQGGNVNAEALAVGAGARASKQGGARQREATNA